MMECHICSNLNETDAIEPWNTPLFESASFVVLPSLGSIVEGWLLLLPRQHLICMAELPESAIDELCKVKNLVTSALQECYGAISVFEHGPSKPNSSVGCTVDHAHLHFVPAAFDLSVAAAPFLPEGICWSAAGLRECRAAFLAGTDYLYLEQPIGTGRMIAHSGLGSQIFRRAIARQLGVPDRSNWRDHPCHDNILDTIRRMQALDGDPSDGTAERRPN